MRFDQKPFVSLTLLIILGVLFSRIIPLTSSFVLIVCLIHFILWFFLEKRGYTLWSTINTGMLVFSLGLFVGLPSVVKKERLKSLSGSFYVEVEEVGRSKREWKRTICRLVKHVDSDGVKLLDEQVLLFVKMDSLKQRDELLIHTELVPILNKGNPAEFDARKYWNNKGIYRMAFVSSADFRWIRNKELSWVGSIIQGVRSRIEKIFESHLEGDALAIVKALTLGDKSQLTSETKESFSRAGAMHVLAVSGLHVGIILYLLMFVFEKVPGIFSKKGALLTAVAVIWIFAFITGASPSVLRASFMFSVLVLGQLLGRKQDGINSLFFSAFILLAVNPLFLYDIGFQLSYLAMLGILTVYPLIASLFYFRNRWMKKLWEGTAIGIAAQVFTIPLTLFYFHRFANYFMLSNVLVMLFAGVILALTFMMLALSWFPILALFTAAILSWLITAFLYLIKWVESLPGAVASGFSISLSSILLFYLFLVFVVLLPKGFEKARWGGLAVILFIFGFWQMQRYKNMEVDQIVVFNAKTPIVSIKNGRAVVCLYTKEKEARFLMKNYMSMYPGNLDLIKLDRGKVDVKVGKKGFLFESVEGGFLIHLDDGELILLRTNYNAKQQCKDCKVIDMPYLKSNSDFYNLSEGAYIIGI